MTLKIKEFFLLIFLVLLQSCSGGKIGNFLESSFDNLDDAGGLKKVENNLENKEVVSLKKREINKNNLEKKEVVSLKKREINKNNLENKEVDNLKKREIEKKSIEENKMKKKQRNAFVNNNVINLEKKSNKTEKNYKEKKELKKRKSELQSYKIIFILKEVDPKDPINELSTILRNSEVNFEIEKIERYLDENKKIFDKD